MEKISFVNREVDIVAFYFQGDRQIKCFPKTMIYKNRAINFTEAGIRCVVKQGDRLIHIFDMHDGETDYRLEFNPAKLTWKLISKTEPESYSLRITHYEASYAV